MSNERHEFSRRLATAMRDKGHAPRPSVLMAQFNSRYTGRSITFQSASRWLGGKSIPEQDKLQVLAQLYGVEPQVLRFGTPAKARVADARIEWAAGAGAQERRVIDAFLALPAKRRALVGELVKALSET